MNNAYLLSKNLFTSVCVIPVHMYEVLNYFIYHAVRDDTIQIQYASLLY